MWPQFSTIMSKTKILDEIRRTAAKNGGVPLGVARFEAETEIKVADWHGIHWVRWGDAVQEAGFEPNSLKAAYDDKHVLRKYAELAVELGCLPVRGDLKLKRRRDPSFPSWNVFSRLGDKASFLRQLADFCRSTSGFESVVEWADNQSQSRGAERGGDKPRGERQVGYVYLIKHGARREYKIGRTTNALRREGEIGIELPEKVQPIHIIETDDPPGIEAYWHNRFAAKRKNGEWFELSASDVAAFRRWKRI